MFLKDNLAEQGVIDQGSASHIIFMDQNRIRFGIPFFMTALIKNVEEAYSCHMSMFQKYLQLDTMTLA